jgi:hypothetical protein
MSPMHLPKQIIPSRSITCDVIKFSKIGGRHSTLIFHFPTMRLFLSSRTSRAILKARASGSSIDICSLLRSSSRTIYMPRVCTTALSMVSLFYSFLWSTIFPLHTNLRKCIPSSGVMKHFNSISISQSYTHVSMSSNQSNEFVSALDVAEPLEPIQHSKLDSTRFR